MIIKPLYWYWENFLTPQKIKKINNSIIKNSYEKEPLESGAKYIDGKSKKNVECYMIEYGKIKNLISNCVNQFFNSNNENFGYDLFSLMDSNFLIYNLYDSTKKGHYDWHKDASEKFNIDTKLTALINLSEKKFDGGDFILNDGNEEIIDKFKNPGSMLMFKSFTLHKVTPVTSGVRKTLTLFLNGPKLR
jgi:PKHD-type hydroxylase